MYNVVISNRAEKDMDTCTRAGYGRALAKIMLTLEKDPYEKSQGFERLTGNLKGLCSRQINHKHRVLYTVLQNTDGAVDKDGNLYDGIVLVHEAWGHRYRPKK